MQSFLAKGHEDVVSEEELHNASYDEVVIDESFLTKEQEEDVLVTEESQNASYDQVVIDESFLAQENEKEKEAQSSDKPNDIVLNITENQSNERYVDHPGPSANITRNSKNKTEEFEPQKNIMSLVNPAYGINRNVEDDLII